MAHREDTLERTLKDGRRLRLGYTVWGDASSDAARRRPPPLVLVMGLSGTQDDWDPIHQLLAAGERGRLVLTLDNRGMGKSFGLEGEPVTLSDMAADVVAVVEHLGWREIDLMGWSMGGMIAQTLLILTGHDVEGRKGSGGLSEGMDWTLERHFAIRKVILAATSNKAPRSDLPEIMRHFSALQRKGPLTDEQKMEVGLMFWRAQYQEDWLEDEKNLELMHARLFASMSSRRPAKQTLAQSRALFKFDLTPWASLVPTTLPILVIHGKRDRTVYFDEALDLLKTYPQAKLSQFDQVNVAGHWWFDFKREEDKVADIVNFLDGDSKL